ncbi:MAG: DUF2911 domain-containing protein [Acidobacteriaceae bacterium]|nr:DUF2911 domain-containing protein [Acidobacteriaceae bacterium]
MMNRKEFCIALVCFVAVPCAFGQASPPAETSVTIKGHKITINYSAPSMRGRKIFGSLVPYGNVWRTGANNATNLTTDGDLMFGSLKVPKGSYSLFTVPNEGSWDLIINKQTGQSGLDYEQGQDLGRVKMSVSKAESTEKFRIALASSGANKGTLTMTWENTAATVNFTVQ